MKVKAEETIPAFIDILMETYLEQEQRQICFEIYSVIDF